MHVPYTWIVTPGEKRGVLGAACLPQLSSRPEPFFLMVGLKKPHSPFNAPKSFYDDYPLDGMPEPLNAAFPTSNVTYLEWERCKAVEHSVATAST